MGMYINRGLNTKYKKQSILYINAYIYLKKNILFMVHSMVY